MNMGNDVIAINGVDAASGDYLIPPLSARDVSKLAQGEPIDPSLLADQKAKLWRESEQHFAPMEGIDANDLSQAGWGVVFAHDADPAIREAMKELLDFRKGQAGAVKEKYYREFVNEKGYRAGEPRETKRTFLARGGAAAGQPADPEKVPYYLLIIGDPASIPYRFQYQIDVEYAVGRVWFERGDGTPDLEAFARYARSVVEAESGRVPLARRASFVGVQNDDDRATRLSAEQLVRPLAEDLAREHAGWEFRTHLGDEAKKSRVAGLLGGAETPAFLFTASHGIGFPNGDTRQIHHQGALLCQDWPGPLSWKNKPIGADFYLSGDDVGDDARLLGLLAFHFACYGAGTPNQDDFAFLKNLQATQRDTIAPRPFVARLPQRLLGHPKGGALAVIGHVERAWGCSFFGGGKLGRQLQTFKSTLTRLLEGQRVGWALEYFNQYYAALSADLSEELENIKFGKTPDDLALSEMWTSNNDARSFVVVGDPAVRLTFPGGAGERPTIRPVDESSLVLRRSESEGRGGPESLVAGQPATRHDASAESGPAPSGGAGDSDEAVLTIHLEVRVRVGAPGATPRLVVRAGTEARDALPSDGLVASSITIDPQYGNREGYDPEFLGSGALRVPLPRLSRALRAQAARLAAPEPGADPHELKYHHFSVYQHKARRFAIVTAVNIDGRLARPIRREADHWIFDPRIDLGSQAGDEFYTHNEFDRGHLVRRLDPAWGRTDQVAKVANDDTFHFTNCTLQHARFNEGKNLWAGLEDYLLGRATGDRKRLTVFTGPVFADDDPEHRGVRVPRQFWKVAVTARPDGTLACLAFLASQADLLTPEVVFATPVDVARTFQVTVSRLEVLTRLDFGCLRELEAPAIDSFAPEAAPGRPLDSFDDILIPGMERSTAARPSRDPGGSHFAVGAAAAPPPTGPSDPVRGTSPGYYLLAYDSECREVTPEVTGRAFEALATEPITDVWLLSHGWRGDVPAAREQFAGWIGAMAAQRDDIARMRAVRPNFRPLLVGLHWPSEPWGDESLAGSVSFALDEATAAASVAGLVDDYARRLGDRPEVRDPLRTIVEAAQSGAEPDHLPPEVEAAYRSLDRALGLGAGGVGAEPGSDREPFDPEAVYREALEDAGPAGFGFGLPGRDTLLAPLRTLSFWTMKDRARRFGEGAVHPLLRRLMDAAAGRDARFHLMGHSFGCIVASAAVAGPPRSAALPRPVDSLALVQGAFSLWSYCSDIPHAPGTPGYFRRVIGEVRVRGPIVTTQSRFDTAVGKWYPRAAWAGRQVAFTVGELPKYGAVGSYGIQGPGVSVVNDLMRPAGRSYDFQPGRVYNLEGSQFINEGGGASGAHSDIRKPAVAHALWEAMRVG